MKARLQSKIFRPIYYPLGLGILQRHNCIGSLPTNPVRGCLFIAERAPHITFCFSAARDHGPLNCCPASIRAPLKNKRKWGGRAHAINRQLLAELPGKVSSETNTLLLASPISSNQIQDSKIPFLPSLQF
jgi:hypothetical protein